MSLHGKHPSDLTPEEVEKFKFSQQYKLQRGEPIESDVIYQQVEGLGTVYIVAILHDTAYILEASPNTKKFHYSILSSLFEKS